MSDSSLPLVLEVSSDEDGDILGSFNPDDVWISDIFHEDDLAVVSELSADPRKKKKKEEADDDDCVVLEEDPHKKPEEIKSHGDTEELLIVGEKGQIACRDYPHARHFCAKFPFASTPHVQHCDLCHCYVCDSLAPCIRWGTGSSNTDHCHSTHEDPFWKSQRDNFKKGIKAQLPPPQPLETPLLPQEIQVPSSTSAQMQLAMQRIHAYTASTNSSSQNILSRNKFNPQLLSQQLLSSCNQRNSNLGPQYFNRTRIFKKPGNSPTNGKYVSQSSKSSVPLPSLSNRGLTNLQRPVTRGISRKNYGGTSLSPQIQASLANFVSPQIQAYINTLKSGSLSVSSVSHPFQAFNNPFKSVTPSENSVSPQIQALLNQNKSSTPLANSVYPQIQDFNNKRKSKSGAFSANSESPQLQAFNNQLKRGTPLANSVSPQLQAFNNPQTQTYNQPNYLQQGDQSGNALNYSSNMLFQSFVSPTDQYSKLDDDFPVQDSALAYLEVSVAPDPLSYLCENDSFLMGFDFDNDKFD